MRLLEASKSHCNLYFLFFASPNEEQSQLYKTYGQAIYWKDFESAQQLLKSLIPYKVVFLYIESYNHVVLNLACKEAGIPTYLLEHGLRADYVVGFDPSISPGRENRLSYYYQVLRDFRARVKSRKFLDRSISLLKPENSAFAKEFVQVRSKYNYLDTFRRIKSDKRLADYYIGFSPKIFESFKAHEAPYFGGSVKYIGIPYFDKLAALTPAAPGKNILLIDQPLAEQGLLQWDMKYKTAFASTLISVCQKHQYQLYIKPHPKQDLTFWQKYEKQNQCTLVNDERLMQLAPGIPVVLGFYSTYLMPFAAYPHTSVITFENHPAGDYVVSKPLAEAGVAHPIYTLDELHDILQKPDIILKQQLPHKAAFIEDWMYKFDGKSGERLRDILAGDTF